jgi:hypothetical protein
MVGNLLMRPQLALKPLINACLKEIKAPLMFDGINVGSYECTSHGRTDRTALDNLGNLDLGAYLMSLQLLP